MFGKKKNEEEKKENSDIEEKTEKIEFGNIEEKDDVKEKLEKGWLKCHFVFEVVGKPAEFIEQTLKELLNQFEKEKRTKILSKETKKAEPYQSKESQEELFSTFAEVEIIIENLRRLVEITFDYMPSIIEISEPSDIKMNIADCNLFINELATKLHKYDLSNKKLLFERDILYKKFQNLVTKIKEAKKLKEEKTENKD